MITFSLACEVVLIATCCYRMHLYFILSIEIYSKTYAPVKLALKRGATFKSNQYF